MIQPSCLRSRADVSDAEIRRENAQSYAHTTHQENHMESFGEILRETFPVADLEIATEIRNLVVSVRCNNKPGKITIEFAVEPDGENRVRIRVPTVSSKAPQPNRESALFFLDEDGNLSRRDPRQRTLEGLVNN